jgi:glycosyltransferase involved in cell wall biosynthesis
MLEPKPQIPRQFPAARTAQTRVVAILDHTASLGGGEIAILNLVRSLDPRRYRPLVLLFSNGPLRRKLEEAGIPTAIVPLDQSIVNTSKDTLGRGTLLRLREILLSASFVWRLAGELRRRNVDLVHTNSLKSDILGGAAARLAGIPLIWHVRDRIENDYLPRPVVHLFRWLARWVPHHVIANSAATLSTLRPPATPRYHVVHDGTHRAADQTPATSRHDELLVVGLVGRITPWKGQHVFLRAASLVHRRFPNARFQIVGSALFNEIDYERYVRRLAVSLGLSDVVEFTGFREDVPKLIAKMDLVVHASTTGEPFGQVILEGMAAGKPIIATNGGGVPEIVVDGQTGLLVPMGNVPAMAKAICRFLADPARRAEAGRRGRQRLNERFTIQFTADKVQRLYDEVLVRERRRKRPSRACQTDPCGRLSLIAQ